jgi:glutamate dehydrogenase
VATAVAATPYLMSAFDVVDVAHSHEADLFVTAELFAAVGAATGLAGLGALVSRLPAASHWELRARAAMREDRYGLQRMTAELVLRDTPPDGPPSVDGWLAAQTGPLPRAIRLVHDLELGPPDAATIGLALRELRAALDQLVATAPRPAVRSSDGPAR